MVVIKKEGGVLSENQYCKNIDLVKGFGVDCWPLTASLFGCCGL